MTPSSLHTPPSARSTVLWTLYAMSIFFTLHTVVPVYINSTYLSSFAGEEIVGIIYGVAAVMTIISILSISRAVEQFGNYRTTLTLIVLEMCALLGLALFQSFLFVTFTFLFHFILSAVLKFNLDIFLESVSDDDNTGKIRGAYLTSVNVAFIFGPTLAGLTLTDGNYWSIYLLSFLFLVPMLVLLMRQMKTFPDSDYVHVTFIEGFAHLRKNADIFNIWISNLFLKFFFAWMIVYTPIYLHNHIGFDFRTIGIIFSIMLSAYLFVELPLGKLADEKYGEKELLSLGFVIIAVATGLLSFISGSSFILWAGLLFVTRVGAAMIEVMSETYFFKQIDTENIDYLSFFRMARPVAYIGASILASIFLYFFPFQYLFLAIGIFMLLGLNFSLAITDTK